MPTPELDLDADTARRLLSLARRSIALGAESGSPLEPPEGSMGEPFDAPAATFVTLEKGGDLRGCVGTLRPVSSLARSVAHNAFQAAFRDGRFPPVSLAELDALHIKISILGPAEPLEVSSRAELLAVLRPGVDGLILEEGARRATFLPQVWESLAEPADFVAHLEKKGGWSPGYWSTEMRAHRYQVESFEE